VSDGTPARFYRWEGADLILSVLVQPRASHNQVVGVHGEHLRIRVTAAPVEGKANQAVIKLLGKLFHVPPSRLCIEKGDSAKFKRVRVTAPASLPEYILKSDS